MFVGNYYVYSYRKLLIELYLDCIVSVSGVLGFRSTIIVTISLGEVLHYFRFLTLLCCI